MLHETPIYPGALCRHSPAGRWIEVVYDASLLAAASRPFLVITSRTGTVTRQTAPAPVLGRAIWIGRIPTDASRIHLESLTPIRLNAVTSRALIWRLAHALMRHPRHTAAASALLCLGRIDRARRRLARALTERPLAAYAAWARPRRRPYEPDGLDVADPAHAPIRRQIEVTLSQGEELTPWALDAAAAAFAADASLAVIQGDSEILTPGGLAAGFTSAWTPPQGALLHRTGVAGGRTARLRSILTRHPPRTPAPTACLPDLAAWPSVAVIVPTRDRLDLLRVCVDGVLDRTDFPSLTLIVADNDSAEPETLSFLATRAAEDPRIRVLPCPGPFNFSAICNRAAAVAEADLLVFLNNDIEIARPDWLKALARQAVAPGTGAVGPTLLYPNGRIQHVGVALGPGGTAGHILGGQPAAALGAVTGSRTVSAVTGACFAVQRDRFQEVGGFDEAFAVTYNDIDLCLRLAARGYGTIWTNETHLIHRESASRGTKKLDHEAIALFRARWGSQIADDPHFHPAFSDSALDLAMG
jgi:GT2 family glycosyltransferase